MRKIFLLPLLLCLFLVACDKEDKTDTVPAAKELIKGTWVTLEMKYELYDAGGKKLAEKKDVKYDRFIFDEKNVIALDDKGNPVNSAYTITEARGSNSSLNMTIESLPTPLSIAEINNTALLLRADKAGDTQNLSTTLSEKDKRLATTRLTIQLNKLQ